jgi:hypothetical protein
MKRGLRDLTQYKRMTLSKVLFLPFFEKYLVLLSAETPAVFEVSHAFPQSLRRFDIGHFCSLSHYMQVQLTQLPALRNSTADAVSLNNLGIK